MSQKQWPNTWPVKLGNLEIELPLVGGENGFKIYAFDPMGRTAWNLAAAEALAERLAPFDFDVILTAESKAIALAEELSRLLGHRDYVVLRKGLKLYMIDPLVVDVKSITTAAPQKFYLGSDRRAELAGKRVCVLDDVISAAGTLKAIHDVAKAAPCTVAVNACVLTEETRWESYEGTPVVSLDHIPLPGFSEQLTVDN